MPFDNLIYRTYSVARGLVRAVGLAKPIRRSLGPVVGRFLYRMSSNNGRPATVRGHKMFLAPRDAYPSPDMVGDHYEESTAGLFEQLLSPGMVVVDVGAHVGFFTLLAARSVGPQGKVYSFEPEPRNYALLEKNLGLNGYSWVVATQKAISNSPGSADLYLSSLDTGSHSIFSRAARGVAGTLTVSATTVDCFLQEVGWPHVDLVKIDVEGAEITVLEGMARFFESQRAVKLIVEYCPTLLSSAGSEPSELLDRLVSLGFEVNVIDDNKGPVPLAAADPASLTANLLRHETYRNLYCSRS